MPSPSNAPVDGEEPGGSVLTMVGLTGGLLAIASIVVLVLAANDDSMGVLWWIFGLLAVALIVIAVVRSFLADGPTVDARRLRIAVLTTAVTIGVLAICQLTLSVNDHLRDAGDGTCASAPAAPTDVADSTDAATSEATVSESSESSEPSEPSESSEPAEPSAPPTSEPASPDTADEPDDGVVSPPADGAPHVEEFGYERVVRTERFPVAVAGGDSLTVDDFHVFTDDGRSGRQFASVVGVEDLGAGEWRVVVEFDVRCYSPWEGGTFPVTVVHTGTAQVAPARWAAEVALQSRVVVFGLAIIPWTLVLAIYLVFDVWPMGLKRWVGSLIGMGGATVGAYTASGLRDPSWRPTVFAVGALVAVTWAAAIAAAVVAKKGGYDLDDGSSPAAQDEALKQEQARSVVAGEAGGEQVTGG